MDFPLFVARFAEAMGKLDSAAASEMFTDDGVYIDGFHGSFRGKPAIAGMIDTHFAGAGRDYRWQMFEPVLTDNIGYARYLFSYTSTLPEAEGKRVVFDGMSRFVIKDDKIRHYSEVFDRGLALSQLGFPPERIAKVVARAAEGLRAMPDAAPHLRD